MKYEVVIIAGSCYPISSATGGIALKCADYLKETCNIRIIALQEENHAENGTLYRNASIYTLTNWRYKWAQMSKLKWQAAKGRKKTLYSCSNYMARAIGRIQSALFYVDNSWWYKRKSVRLLEKMNKQKPIDVILSFCAPIEAHAAAMEFKSKHSNICWISYWADLFATKQNCRNLFISLIKMKQMEDDMLEASNHVFVTDEVYQVFADRAKQEIHNKMEALPYIFNQNILERDNYVAVVETEPIRCVYMGSFYRDIRNPEYMLELFCKLKQLCVLDLYTTGNCGDIVERISKKSNGRIIEHGLVPKEALDEVLRNAHVLINIENTVSTSNPSKLFELMSYRKPIIDFSHNEDPSEVIKKYPTSINVDMEKACQDESLKVDEFLSEIRKFKPIDYKIIEKKFARNFEHSYREKVTGAIADQCKN